MKTTQLREYFRAATSSMKNNQLRINFVLFLIKRVLSRFLGCIQFSILDRVKYRLLQNWLSLSGKNLISFWASSGRNRFFCCYGNRGSTCSKCKLIRKLIRRALKSVLVSILSFSFLYFELCGFQWLINTRAKRIATTFANFLSGWNCLPSDYRQRVLKIFAETNLI